MLFDMLLLLLLFVFVYHCIIMKAYETTNQLGFSAVVVVGVAVVVVLLDQNFSDEAATVNCSVENQRVDRVCSVAVGRWQYDNDWR